MEVSVWISLWHVQKDDKFEIFFHVYNDLKWGHLLSPFRVETEMKYNISGRVGITGFTVRYQKSTIIPYQNYRFVWRNR